MAKKVSSELVCAVAVIFAAAGGGTYFYFKGEEPVKVLVARKVIERGPITPADVKQATIKRRDVPSWLNLANSPEAKQPYRNVMVEDVNELAGGTVINRIETGFYLYRGSRKNDSGPTVFSGAQIGNGPVYAGGLE